MELLNAYLEEIRHRLPLKNRADIIEEIRSALMDMIEERSPGGDPDDATVKAVLMEYGAPREVARQYASHQSLIGPQIFPVYLQVLKIVLIVVAALNIVGLIVSIVNGSIGDNDLFIATFETVGGLFSSLFTAFAIVTLSFTLIERFAAEELQAEMDEDWSPEDLTIVEIRKRVKISEVAVEITFGIIFILLINLYLDRIGIYYLGDAGWVSAPILNDNVLRYIPWITGATMLDIALNLYLIRKEFWDASATIVKVIINVLKIALLAVIIAGPAIIAVSPSAWQALNLEVNLTAQQLTRQMNTVLDGLLGLAIFGLVVDSIKIIVNGFFRNDHTRLHIKTE
jgi:hypothetical protein